MNNFLSDIPDIVTEEIFDEIISNQVFKLERIISDGHASPENFWYDQDKNEFVLLISGTAEIQYDDGQKFSMKKGDYFIIPAHQKHRVEWTDKHQKTVWLALHF
jgi:cupin 2 domain-containing protein